MDAWVFDLRDSFFSDIQCSYVQMRCDYTKFSEYIVQMTWLFELPGSSSHWLHSYSACTKKLLWMFGFRALYCVEHMLKGFWSGLRENYEKI